MWIKIYKEIILLSILEYHMIYQCINFVIFEIDVFWTVWDVSLTLNANSIGIYATIIISKDLCDITQDLIDRIYKLRNRNYPTDECFDLKLQ